MPTFEEAHLAVLAADCRITSVFENCRGNPDLAWAADVATGRYFFENNAWGHALGATPGEAIEKALAECILERDDPNNIYIRLKRRGGKKDETAGLDAKIKDLGWELD